MSESVRQSGLSPEQQNIDALQLWFGPNWTWTQMAEWIEARAKSEQMPRFAVYWASDYLRMRRGQEDIWNDYPVERIRPDAKNEC